MTGLTPATVAAVSFASPAITARNVPHLQAISLQLLYSQRSFLFVSFPFLKKKRLQGRPWHSSS